MAIEALIGGVIAGGLGLLGSNKQADATKDAARASAETQRYIFDRSVEMQEPFRRLGLSALNPMADLLGLEQPVPGGYSSTGGILEPGSLDYGGYLEDYPDLTSWYSGLNSAEQDWIARKGYDRDNSGSISREEAAAYHYDTHGRGEGRQIGTVQGGQTGGGAPGAPAYAGGDVTLFGEQVTDPRLAALLQSPGARDSLNWGYDRAVGEGTAQLAAAGVYGGRAAEALSRTANDYARTGISGLYNQRFNELASLAGFGQTANSAQAAAGQNYANATTAINSNLANALNQNTADQYSFYGNIAGQAFDWYNNRGTKSALAGKLGY